MVLSAADHHFSGLKWGQRVGPTLGEWRGIFLKPYQEYCFSHIRMWSWKTQLSNFKTRTQQFILQWKILTPRRLLPFQKWNEHPPESTSPYPPTKREVSKKSSGVIFFQRTKPRPVSTPPVCPTTTPLPRTCRKATLPRARFTIRNCGLAGSEKRMIKALESCDGWEVMRDTFEMKTWLFMK